MTTLFVAYRVTDLDHSLTFYTALGYIELGRVQVADAAPPPARPATWAFDTYVVGDAGAPTNRIGPDDVNHQPELIHQLSLANLHGEFCTVLQTAEALTLLTADAPPCPEPRATSSTDRRPSPACQPGTSAIRRKEHLRPGVWWHRGLPARSM